MNEDQKNQIQAVTEQAEKLDRYINQYVSRSLRVNDALGDKGAKMLNELFLLIENLD